MKLGNSCLLVKEMLKKLWLQLNKDIQQDKLCMLLVLGHFDILLHLKSELQHYSVVNIHQGYKKLLGILHQFR